MNEIAHSTLQANISQTLNRLQVNLDKKISQRSILQDDLIQLQILIKSLIGQLIIGSMQKSQLTKINELITNGIYLIRSREQSISYLDASFGQGAISKWADQFLEFVGFSFQRAMTTTTTTVPIEEQNTQNVLFYPPDSYLDLNVRAAHVFDSILTLPAHSKLDSNMNLSRVLHVLEKLIPMQDGLLKTLINIAATTLLFPELIISMNDCIVNCTLSFDKKDAAEVYLTDIVDFLLSLGYETVQDQLYFRDTAANRTCLEAVLKILTSFSIERDTSYLSNDSNETCSPSNMKNSQSRILNHDQVSFFLFVKDFRLF
jgi:hypothetical protein